MRWIEPPLLAFLDAALEADETHGAIDLRRAYSFELYVVLPMLRTAVIGSSGGMIYLSTPLPLAWKFLLPSGRVPLRQRA